MRIAATHLCRQERLAAVHNALKLSRRSVFSLRSLPQPAATAALPPAEVLASRHDPFFSLSAASRDLAAQIASLSGPGAAGAAPLPDHTLALVVQVIVQRSGALLPGAGTMAALATLATLSSWPPVLPLSIRRAVRRVRHLRLENGSPLATCRGH